MLTDKIDKIADTLNPEQEKIFKSLMGIKADSSRGRPDEYTKEIGELFCAIKATSLKTNKEICEEFDVFPSHVSLIYYWMKQHPDFFERYTLAQAMQQELNMDGIDEIVIQGLDYSNDPMQFKMNVERAKLKFDLLKYKIGKCAPQKYGAAGKVENKVDKMQETLEGMIGKLKESVAKHKKEF